MKKFFYALLALIVALPCVSQNEEVIAFPGAEGWGRHATGGRGGRIVFVTNTDDYTSSETPIEGSFRAAMHSEQASRMP